MKKRGVVLICLGLALGVAGRTEYAVQPVADVPVTGRVWNLTCVEPVGPEVDYRVDTGERDRVWSAVKRFDFMTTSGDTVFQTCAETRSYRTVFTPGILRGLPDGAGGSGRFGFKGRIYQSRFVIGEGTSAVDRAVRGVLVIPAGDSIRGASMFHDRVSMRWSVTADSLADFSLLPDSMIHMTVVDSYRIMVPSMPFPYALKRVDTVIYDGRIVSRDSMAWISGGSPSAEMERIRCNLLPDGADRDVTVRGDGIDDIVGRVDISIGGNDIVVSSGGNVQAGIVITDMLGRTYYEGNAMLSPSGSTVPTESLPRGEYLIQVIPVAGGETTAMKFVR